MKKLFLMAVVALYILPGCKKDEDNQPQAAAPTEAELEMHAHLVWGTQMLATTGTLVTPSDDTIQVTSANLYLTDFVLIKEDNSIVQLNQTVLVKTGVDGGFSLGSVPIGNYKGFRFSVGSSNMNTLQPTDFADGHVLGVQIPNMWWSWGSGYIFVRVDGKVDFNGNGNVDDDASNGMELHLGLNANVVNLPTQFVNAPFTVTNDGGTIHMNIDLKNLFTGLDMHTEYMTHSMGAGATLAAKLKNNVASMFSLE